MSKLSKDFLWGGAISANQSEGAYLEDGKGLSIFDILEKGSKDQARILHESIEEHVHYPSHDAIDFYHTYREDIRLFKELGLRCLRTSINWTRIYPNGIETAPNEKGLRYYRNVFEELLAQGITPIVTLHHSDTPLYLAKTYGGWKSRKTVECFERYAKTILTYFQDLIQYWIVINEINALNYVEWIAAAAQQLTPAEKEQVAYHLLLANAKTVQLAKQINSSFMMGGMVTDCYCYPYTCNPEDVLESLKDVHENIFYADVMCRGYYPKYKQKELARKGIKLLMQEGDEEILQGGTIDFLAFSYYSSHVSSKQKDEAISGNLMQNIKGKSNPYLEQSTWGWSIDPLGLRISLNEFYDRYQLPLFIVENGLGAEDDATQKEQIQDSYRIEYLKKHIQAMKDAIILDGVELMGYLVWGVIDIVSGVSGEMEKRYGLIYVDKDNEGNGSNQRYKKQSFYWYQGVIASDGESL